LQEVAFCDECLKKEVKEDQLEKVCEIENQKIEMGNKKQVQKEVGRSSLQIPLPLPRPVFKPNVVFFKEGLPREFFEKKEKFEYMF
jgi:NAD-dependent SIR2 family protein deacetylase